jgi:hypothetical protein
VGLVSVSPREPRTKALAWELVHLWGIADTARQGDCLPQLQVDARSTLGHHSPVRPTRPSSLQQARFLGSQHPQLFFTDADTAIHSFRGV